jgi:hypothetical protein
MYSSTPIAKRDLDEAWARQEERMGVRLAEADSLSRNQDERPQARP